MYLEEDYISLSGIQHFAYCRKQWGLIHIEQLWAENVHTTEGHIFHRKAHSQLMEKRGELLIARGLKVSSPQLGVVGVCDVVEFHQSTDGIFLNNYDGTWIPCPVEYKKGNSSNHECNILQLQAQAICLEEMLLCEIPRGYIYYGKTKEKRVVDFTKDLSFKTKKLIDEMHSYHQRNQIPSAKYTAKCNECSLNIFCQPNIEQQEDVEKYINRMIYE